MATSLNGTFNLGTDISVTIIDNTTGNPIDVGGRLVSFKGDPIIDQVTSTPIDNAGFDQKRQVRKGHNLAIMIDRAYGALDIFDAQIEAEYHNGTAQRSYTIQALVYNSINQTTTTITYIGCLIELKSTGEFSKDKKVEVALDAWAQFRTATGG